MSERVGLIGPGIMGRGMVDNVVRGADAGLFEAAPTLTTEDAEYTEKS